MGEKPTSIGLVGGGSWPPQPIILSHQERWGRSLHIFISKFSMVLICLFLYTCSVLKFFHFSWTVTMAPHHLHISPNDRTGVQTPATDTLICSHISKRARISLKDTQLGNSKPRTETQRCCAMSIYRRQAASSHVPLFKSPLYSAPRNPKLLWIQKSPSLNKGPPALPIIPLPTLSINQSNQYRSSTYLPLSTTEFWTELSFLFEIPLVVSPTFLFFILLPSAPGSEN